MKTKNKCYIFFFLGVIFILIYTISVSASCIDPCTQSELGKKKCVVGWTAIGTVDEVRECKFYTLGNCYGYERVKNCKGTGLSCSNSNNIVDCKCPVSQSCTPGQKRCLNSLPISPAGPDEIQQCNTNGCGWMNIQSCNTNQDCIISNGVPQCVTTSSGCTPYWQCSQWSTCTNNIQTRTCTDSNNCGTTTGKPAVTQSCTSQQGLNEIQLAACESADDSNSCNSLNQLNIVTKEQCCSNLNLCCSNIISISEFKVVLINSLKDYFTNPNNAKLNVNEIKDLIVVYFSSHGNTVDLSGIGTYSKEKLIDIYNKAKGITTQTCSSAGGTCKENSCNTYNNCNSLSNGQCTSGNCCSGSCGTSTYPKLDQIAPGSGDFYGGTISIAAGEVKTYILPLGEVYPGQSLRRLLVESAALIDGTGQVSAKLTSPDIPPWSQEGLSSTADFSFNAVAQSYPQYISHPYPATYLNNGYWILEITGVLPSQFKLWWKCY